MTKKQRMTHEVEPPHLRPETRDWWRWVVENFDLEEHHRRLLLLACQAYDDAQQAREVLRTKGPTYEDRFGAPRSRPEVAIERDARLAFSRLLRELGLDADGPAEGPRPPRIRG